VSAKLTCERHALRFDALEHRLLADRPALHPAARCARAGRSAGQREEASVGLYDYNARMYSPLLGRFLAPDTLVPRPDDPQSFNRYSYVLNNPLRYTDPSGHCPAPPKGFGPAICFALFIKPPTISVSIFSVTLSTLHGDGRDFSPDSDPKASRVWVWISVDQAKHTVGVNPTGYYKDGSIEWTPPSAQNKIEVSRGREGEINVSYDLVLSGKLEDIAPHINGSITFVPDRKKGGYTAYGERDGFPWAEAYYHDGKGRVQTIFQRPALRGNPHDLKALETYDFSKKPLHTLQRLQTLTEGPPRLDTLCVPGRPC
jgi:RHS repeat-associated protein